ncbi:MAG TPA: SWIM zinc finger family protein [Rhizomicrobium sp.]|nr:SWIM zinc finger family protein [Rhizomicrobium sp.]
MAGDLTFVRGQAYCDDGKVEIVAVEAAGVAARVRGTEVYRTKLEGSDKRFAGECSCPAFADRGFCKHLIATALAANALSHDAAKAIGSRFARIRDHLRAQGTDALVDKLMALAERDDVLLRDLELAAAIAGENDKAVLMRFRGAIADAMSTHGFVEYSEVGGWASGVETVLDGIENLVAQDRPALALTLLDDFFDEMEDALGEIDDSDGQGGELVARAGDIHLKACLAAKPDSVELAQSLYAREVSSKWDFFQGASETYAEVLGEAGLAEYRRLAMDAWKKLKPLHPRSGDEDRYGRRSTLASILESFAERDGDLDARIEIRKKDLSSAYEYLGIAQLCAAHGRDADALTWAEEGLWQFEDNPDTRLIVFAGELYARLGRMADAEAVLWREFERTPSVDFYKQMKTVLGEGKSVRDRAVAFLKALIAGPRSRSAPRWASLPDVLVRLLVEEKLFDDAWGTAAQHDVRMNERMRLAEASEASHPGRVWTVYADHVENIVRSGGQRNYQEACKFIARIGDLRAKLGETNAHAAWLDGLALRHKAKRNFMKLLGR